MKTYCCPCCGETLLLVESDHEIEEWKNSPRMRVLRKFEDAEDNLERVVREGIQNKLAGSSIHRAELLFALQDWFLTKQAVDHE